MYETQELLLQLCDDSCLYSLRNAAARVRRVARNVEAQKEMGALQLAIKLELESREKADS